MRRLALAALLLGSCVSMDGVYGTKLTDEQIGRLQPGMDAAQVRAILGEPQHIQHFPDGERWAYAWFQYGQTQTTSHVFEFREAPATTGGRLRGLVLDDPATRTAR